MSFARLIKLLQLTVELIKLKKILKEQVLIIQHTHICAFSKPNKHDCLFSQTTQYLLTL